MVAFQQNQNLNLNFSKEIIMRVQKSVLGFNIHQVSRRLTWKDTNKATFALDNGEGKLKHFTFTRENGQNIVKGQFKGAKQFILN